jgi:hypothetical protein
LDHLKLSRLPGPVRSIELTWETGTLRIEAALNEPMLIELNSAGLGEFAAVEAAAGRQRYAMQLDQLRQCWCLPQGAEPSRRWTLSARLCGQNSCPT